MANYRINKNSQSSGQNEVHKEGCQYYHLTNYEYLGNFTTCQEAVRVAKVRGYRNADGCAYCIPTCNNG